MEHRLKTIQPYFNQVLDGSKKFEIRLNDRDYKVGDTLLLEDYDLEGNGFSGEYVRVLVTYILDNAEQYGLKDGYCIMSIQKL